MTIWSHIVRGMDDEVFRALADPTRRLLLDRLFARDGQTVGELAGGLEMTRFGAMKHLRILEAAGLIATRKVGRQKLHYLNPVPIQLIADRWVSKFAAPWASALSAIKTRPGGRHDRDQADPRLRGLHPDHARPTVAGDHRRSGYRSLLLRHHRRARPGEPGAPLTYAYPDGSPPPKGTVLEVDTPNRLVTTFHAVWDDETKADRPHRMTWEITPLGETCRLVVTSDDFDGETATFRSFQGGMSVILSGLKTLLETGEPLPLGS